MVRMTALGVRRLVTPGRHGDGGGLYLQVRDAEHRSWLYRYRLHGRDREMGLGPLSDVPLAEARDAAMACRKLVRAGIDPIEHRQAQRAAQKAEAAGFTFQEVAARYIKAHEAGWRNAKHGWQWGQTLKTYAYPAFGDQLVAVVDTAAVLRALESIWRTKSETASRVRGRIEAVLDYATAQGWRVGDNPARWRGHLSNLLPAPRSVAKVEHHAALPYSEVAAFLARVAGQGGTAAVALRFVVLTACRTSEALGATWRELDIPNATWTIPGARMKAGREHRVPLSAPALAILATMALAGSEPHAFVFPGNTSGRGKAKAKGKARPLSNMAMMALLRRMDRPDLTVHGFRSTFRDWAAEETSASREVAEMALAHTLKDKTEAAYRRGDLFAKRAALMADWAEFCIKAPTP